MNPIVALIPATRTGRIRYLNPYGIVLDNGMEIPCDLIVYCTGYSASYKFFDPRYVA